MTSPQIKSEKNYDIVDHIGHGAFGAVYKIIVHEDHKEYALKNIKLNGLSDVSDSLKDAKKEYSILRKDIPNVLRAYGSYHEPNEKFVFSTELMKMSLQELIDNDGSLCFQKFIPLFKDILSGKLYLRYPPFL
jgi:serine/threonine protein kinase